MGLSGILWFFIRKRRLPQQDAEQMPYNHNDPQRY
jgi:hypothetical protein